MFPVSMNLKPGQKLINLDKMPYFIDIKTNHQMSQMIDITKIPMFDSFKNLSINTVPDLSFQEPPLINQDCLL